MTEILSDPPASPARGFAMREYIGARLSELSREEADRLLSLLDEFSRPMTAREIERALRAGGMPRSRCDQVATALKGFAIIAIVPLKEGMTNDPN
jgi:hypothetical protein